MRIGVARETRPGEHRVALVPDGVSEALGLGYTVLVEPGAGAAAGFTDAEYVVAGAEVAADALELADVVLAVQPLDAAGIARLRPGTGLVALLPVTEIDTIAALRDAEVTAFSMELVPRITRAQAMDALTSQSLVAGYRGAVVAAGMLRRFLPLAMTAAGTVPAANALVLGTGVAGLEAIATLQRLGARVSAYDVRASSAEEIRSLGARALDLGLDTLDGSAGYARTMTAGRAAVQRARLTPYVAAADVLLTAAAVPGHRAPVLVTRPMVEEMRPGSVVVDLAADSGGNVEGSVAGKIVRIGEAQVWGGENVAAQLPDPASRLYGRNVLALLAVLTASGETAADGSSVALFAPDFTDEIVAATAVTYAGAITHEAARQALARA